jgi:hypothetical protein
VFTPPTYASKPQHLQTNAAFRELESTSSQAARRVMTPASLDHCEAGFCHSLTRELCPHDVQVRLNPRSREDFRPPGTCCAARPRQPSQLVRVHVTLHALVACMSAKRSALFYYRDAPSGTTPVLQMCTENFTFFSLPVGVRVSVAPFWHRAAQNKLAKKKHKASG